MANSTTPDPFRDGPSEVPPEWQPRIPQPGERRAPREEVPQDRRPTARHTGPDAAVPTREPSQTMGTLMGDVRRTGAWTAAEHTSAYLGMGNVLLDLRDVVRPGETLRLTAFTGLGDVKIAVPPGCRVELQGFNLLGDVRHEVDPAVQAAPETGARLVINASSLLGDVRVRTMPMDDPSGPKPARGWRWTRKA
ncbi:hypothetical protein [Serinicoccus profundi]|uniref:hypothetical protein n=1 Tax=Serinicoccus profundi TaxID=1078471 RepID=UPI000255F7EE|nr:hypothetical protein [Serinicoccus profundi]